MMLGTYREDCHCQFLPIEESGANVEALSNTNTEKNVGFIYYRYINVKGGWTKKRRRKILNLQSKQTLQQFSEAQNHSGTKAGPTIWTCSLPKLRRIH